MVVLVVRGTVHGASQRAHAAALKASVPGLASDEDRERRIGWATDSEAAQFLSTGFLDACWADSWGRASRPASGVGPGVRLPGRLGRGSRTWAQ